MLYGQTQIVNVVGGNVDLEKPAAGEVLYANLGTNT
jgi:hypothetical protein